MECLRPVTLEKPVACAGVVVVAGASASHLNAFLELSYAGNRHPLVVFGEMKKKS